MRLTLNGEEKQVAARTVSELLQELQAPVTGVAVALNGCVVRREAQASTPLHEGDTVEVIRAVQGG